MKKYLIAIAAVLALLPAVFASPLSAGNYKSYKVAVYARAYEVEKMGDPEWLRSTWETISSQMNVDRIYLETHRDLLIVPQSTVDAAKKFFKEHGVEVAGGITYTVNERNNFETFCYTNPEHRKKVQEIAEFTAKNYDTIILDDFFFTDCKCDLCIEAKGDMSWTEYRLKLMTEAGQNLVIGPAKKINPNVKVIIKYPNWYDDFQGLGFDLEHGPQIFDGVWSGTETRDPAGAQHLQNYLSYNIIRYLDNLRPGHNFGGWVDAGGINMGADRYAEQLWLTMFAKAPEIALFDYRSLVGNTINPAWKTPWQGTGTSFDWDEMMKPFKAGVEPTTIARIAGYTLAKVDPIVAQLGKPLGIVSYKPYHAKGEAFLQNYFGMIGLPMDMRPEFPTDQQVVLLTAQAADDPDIVSKIDAQLHRGGDVVITTGLLKEIPEKIAQFAELTLDGYALVNDFGRNGKSEKDILIPEVGYYTNDTWETISAGKPLTGGTSGWPILLRGKYSKGNLYVLTVPEDVSDMYVFPDAVLNTIRTTLGRDLKARLEGPSKIGLFVYDNDKVIVESFRDEPCEATVVVGDRRIPVSLKPHSFELIDIK
ncbi:MAG: hypothetical protein IKH60_06340 [Bacteroidales bacterium]|nr:hypothetical protein [Bacteroidales bacterium]